VTLKDIEEMTCNTLTVKTVAEFLGKDPQTIRDQAERKPKYLGFPICKAGHSYCIPREGFIAWAKGMTPMIVWKGSGCD
jgi:hypothetical protein